MNPAELYTVVVITAVLCSLKANAADVPVSKSRLVVCYRNEIPDPYRDCSYKYRGGYSGGRCSFIETNKDCTHVIARSSGDIDPMTAYYKGNYAEHSYTRIPVYQKITEKVMQNLNPVKNDYANGIHVLGTENGRSILINSSIVCLTSNGYDGLDVVIEEDRLDDIIRLLLEMRPEFDKNNLLLTALFPAILTQKIDLSYVSSQLDFITIRSFEDEKTGNVTKLSAPLYADEGWSVDSSVNMYINMGVPREKIVVGIPTFAVTHQLEHPDFNLIGSNARKKGQRRKYIPVEGQLALEEIGVPQNTWSFYRDVTSSAPYASSYFTWASYEDEASVKTKARYIEEKGLGGAMLWPSEKYDDSVSSLPFANVLNATFYIRKLM